MQFRKCFFFALLLTANGLFAQDFQLAGINYATFTKTNIKGSPTNQAVKFQEFNAFVKLPIRFRQRNTVRWRHSKKVKLTINSENTPLSKTPFFAYFEAKNGIFIERIFVLPSFYKAIRSNNPSPKTFSNGFLMLIEWMWQMQHKCV